MKLLKDITALTVVLLALAWFVYGVAIILSSFKSNIVAWIVVASIGAVLAYVSVWALYFTHK